MSRNSSRKPRKNKGRPARRVAPQLVKTGAQLKTAVEALQKLSGIEEAVATIEGAAKEIQGVYAAVEALEEELVLHRELIWLILQTPTEETHKRLAVLAEQLQMPPPPQECEHGLSMTDYCEPCGRIHGSL